MIVPVEKKIPVESLDKIPETASMDDYEKIAYRVSMASDEIIDRALDKLDGRKTEEKPLVKVKDRPKKENRFNKKPQKKPEEQNKEPVEEVATGDNTPEQKAENGNAAETPSPDKNRITQLKNELSRLRIEFGRCRSENASLIEKRDNLLLSNSELEFEVSRLSAENLRLKQELEQLSNSKRLPPQTYSTDSYSRVPLQTAPRRNPVIGMNGYESWN